METNNKVFLGEGNFPYSIGDLLKLIEKELGIVSASQVLIDRVPGWKHPDFSGEITIGRYMYHLRTEEDVLVLENVGEVAAPVWADNITADEEADTPPK